MLWVSIGWRSSISAIRYSPIARSVPENSSTKRSGSGRPLREITARRRPAAQPSVRSCNAAAPATDRLIPDAGQQFACLANTEAQIAGSKLGDLAGQPELVQFDRWIAARRQHDVRRFRQRAEQMLELGAGVSGTQLVEIVDHQHDDSGRFGQFRYDRVDNHVAVKIGRGGLPSGISDGVRSPDRLQDGEPELLRILLVAGHRHVGDPAVLARSVGPRP